jgi:hypothetical protein
MKTCTTIGPRRHHRVSNVVPSASAVDVITSKRKIKTTVMVENNKILGLPKRKLTPGLSEFTNLDEPADLFVNKEGICSLKLIIPMPLLLPPSH